MLNKRLKKIQNIPSKEEGINYIGKNVDGDIITNIEWNGQLRVLSEEEFKEYPKERVKKWKKRYKEPGGHFHPGTLLTEHQSEELYEKL